MTWVAVEHAMDDSSLSHVVGPFDSEESASEFARSAPRESGWHTWDVYKCEEPS